MYEGTQEVSITKDALYHSVLFKAVKPRRMTCSLNGGKQMHAEVLSGNFLEDKERDHRINYPEKVVRM
jgi:hypothetical protein